MSPGARNWDDLKSRVLTAIVMIVVGLAALWAGNVWFLALVALVVALMIWELVRMIAPEQGAAIITLSVLAGILIFGYSWWPLIPLWFFVGVVPLVGTIWVSQRRFEFLVYATVIMGGGIVLYLIREDFGLIWMFWLVSVVIVTDIAGYFVGRLVGGPKFWPKVSPKKTWSGTAGGWVGAAIVGAAFAGSTGVGMVLIPASIALSLASQIGDIAESAIKRASGIKDSSNILPGHGGVLDRFDGMIGAAFVLLIILLMSGNISRLS